MHMLYITKFPDLLDIAYKGLLYEFDFNESKYLFCLLETLVVLVFTLRHIRSDSFTEVVMFFLNLLYFIPGFVQQACTNSEWGYMLFYFAFWLGMEIWIRVLKPKEGLRISRFVRINNLDRYLLLLSLFAIVLTIVLSFFFRTSFSLTNLIATFADVYGVRDAALSQGTHWLIVTIEHWAAYYMGFIIVYYTRRKNWLLVIVLVVCVLALFMIQANRIFAFMMLASFGIGLINLKRKWIPFFFVFLAFVAYLETLTDQGLLFTEVFRRFTIVPNKISECYYDFSLTHEPNLLRSNFNRFVKLFGIPSPYSETPIELYIGETYFGWEMVANTGLVGGSAFQFGFFSLVTSTFGYIMSFRLFEGLMHGVNNTCVSISMAVILTVMAINTHALFANFFWITYTMLFFVSLLPLGNKNSEILVTKL